MPEKPKFKVPPRFEKAKWEDVPNVIRETVEKMAGSRKGLFLHGGVGAGKTHIAYGIAKHVYEENRKLVKVWNSAELMERIRNSFDDQTDRELFNDLLEYKGLLVIDDIGSEKPSPWVTERFYMLVNRKYNDMMPVIFTSNDDIQKVAENLGERTASRIVEMCEVIELSGKDRRLENDEN